MQKSKKAQSQSQNPKGEQPVITDEDKQNDPFIRAIAKKIRNITKKISDIELLEKRDDLKPEQQEKINSKQNLYDEKKKFEEVTKFYKSTLVEAATEDKANHVNQVSPLVSRLSAVFITAHYISIGGDAKELDLTQQERTLLTHIGGLGKQETTLKQMTGDLSGYLTQYLDNQKLVAKLDTAWANEAFVNTSVDFYNQANK